MSVISKNHLNRVDQNFSNHYENKVIFKFSLFLSLRINAILCTTEKEFHGV